MQSRVFAIFNILILGNNLVTLAQPMFMKQRQFFKKEYASKFYGWAPFAVNMVLVEIPYLIVCAVRSTILIHHIFALISLSDPGGLHSLLDFRLRQLCSRWSLLLANVRDVSTILDYFWTGSGSWLCNCRSSINSQSVLYADLYSVCWSTDSAIRTTQILEGMYEDEVYRA